MLLNSIGLKHETDKAFYHKYCDFYQRLLPKRTFKGRLLEIGVMDGASIRMWSEYYPHAEIVGLDIIDKSHLNIDRATLLTVDATNPKELAKLGNFDIIIDDGSHMTGDQQVAFEQLFYKQLNKGGFYVIEDLHTSNWPAYINSELNTIEYLKKLKKLKIHYYNKDHSDESMTCVIEAAK